MTKKEVEKDFRQNVKPQIDEMYGKGDKIALREEWNNYTDMLCKDGVISQKQYDTWSNPF